MISRISTYNPGGRVCPPLLMRPPAIGSRHSNRDSYSDVLTCLSRQPPGALRVIPARRTHSTSKCATSAVHTTLGLSPIPGYCYTAAASISGMTRCASTPPPNAKFDAATVFSIRLTTSAAYYPDSRERPRLGFFIALYYNIKVRARSLVCAHTSSPAQNSCVCAYARSATLLFLWQHNVITCTYVGTPVLHVRGQIGTRA